MEPEEVTLRMCVSCEEDFPEADLHESRDLVTGEIELLCTECMDEELSRAEDMYMNSINRTNDSFHRMEQARKLK